MNNTVTLRTSRPGLNMVFNMGFCRQCATRKLGFSSSVSVLPARQEGIGHEDNVGRLLPDSRAKAVIPPIPEHHQLRQAESKNGAAQQAAGEDKRQEVAVVALHCDIDIVRDGAWLRHC